MPGTPSPTSPASPTSSASASPASTSSASSASPLTTTADLRTEITTPSDLAFAITREFDAPRELVFAAFTEPRHVSRWLLGPDGWSMPVCEIDLREGGAWEYRWRSDADGAEFGMSGRYRLVDRPRRLVNTEVFEGQESVVTTEFTEVGARRTRVVQTSVFPSRELRDAVLASGMEGGVSTSHHRLAGLLPLLAEGA